MNKALPSSLYKYQPFNPQHLTILLQQHKIYLSSPKSFNDPWDCAIFFNTTPDLRNSRYASSFQKDASKQIDFSHMLSRLHLMKAITDLSNTITQDIHDRYRVFCMTSEPDCHLMWAHYALYHSGICLEFDSSAEIFNRALKVSYTEKHPIFYPDEAGKNARTLLSTKPSAWEYEHEYRVIANEKPLDAKRAGRLRTKNNFLEIDNDALKSITVGIRMTEEDIETIKILTKKYSPDLKLRRAYKIDGEYKISITDL